MVEFVIPGEPVGKARPRVVRRGTFMKTYTPVKTVDYENLVKLEYRRQCGEKYIAGSPIGMHIVCYYGLARTDSKKKRQAKLEGAIRPTKKPDWDNVSKAICDALNGVAFHDDSQIVHCEVVKLYAENPRVEVGIWKIGRNDHEQFIKKCKGETIS